VVHELLLRQVSLAILEPCSTVPLIMLLPSKSAKKIVFFTCSAGRRYSEAESFLPSQEMSDGEMFEMEMDTEIDYPAPTKGGPMIDLTQAMASRA